MNLDEFLSQFAGQHEYGIRPNTFDQYRFAIKSFSRFLGRPATTEDLAEPIVNPWVDWLAGHRSPHTCRTQRGSILSLWRAAWQEDIVPAPPKRVRRMRMPPAAPVAWHSDDLAVLIARAEALPGRFRGTNMRRAVHVEAFLRCGWDTGLRLGDLQTIRVSQIRRDGRLDVIQSKTGTRQLVRMWPETTAALLATISDDPERDRVFPMVRRTYQQIVGQLARAAGRPGSIKQIRRGVATAAEISGGYGSRMLGHVDGRALRYYLDRSALEPVVAPRLPHCSEDDTRQPGKDNACVPDWTIPRTARLP